jgi:hypothetical protein
MPVSVTLLLLLAGLLMIGFVLGIVRNAGRPASPGVRLAAPPVRPPAGDEREASAASEAIEKLANDTLAKAGLSAKRVDFGTAHDGSLEIWVGDERYTSVEAIPDPVIRQAVADAVAAFNQRPL